MKINDLTEHQISILKDPSVGHSEAGRSLTMARSKIKSIRRRLGTVLGKMPNTPRTWSKAEDSLLETMPTSDLSNLIGASVPSINARRQKLGIKAVRKHGKKK
jgi:hypothetical protein